MTFDIYELHVDIQLLYRKSMIGQLQDDVSEATVVLFKELSQLCRRLDVVKGRVEWWEEFAAWNTHQLMTIQGYLNCMEQHHLTSKTYKRAIFLWKCFLVSKYNPYKQQVVDVATMNNNNIDTELIHCMDLNLSCDCGSCGDVDSFTKHTQIGNLSFDMHLIELML